MKQATQSKNKRQKSKSQVQKKKAVQSVKTGKQQSGSLVQGRLKDPRRNEPVVFERATGVQQNVEIVSKSNTSVDAFIMGAWVRFAELGFTKSPEDFVWSAYAFKRAVSASLSADFTNAFNQYPLGLKCLLDMLMPTIVPYLQGNWSFSASEVPPTFITTVGTDNVFTLKPPDTTVLLAGYHPLTNPVYDGPTSDQMKTSWDNLLKFVASLQIRGGKNNVPSTYVTKFMKDVSSFSPQFQEMGMSCFSGCNSGYNLEVFSEVPIFNPQTTRFASYDVEDRAYRQTTMSNGSAFGLGYYSTVINDDVVLEKHKRQIYKPIDVFDFYYLISAILDEAGQKMINDQSERDYIPCPLTNEEVMLMIRFLCASLKYQALGSDLAYALNSPQVQQFNSITTSAWNATYASSLGNVKLPRFVIENMRTLASKCVMYGQQGTCWVPSFGYYNDLSTADLTNFNVSWGSVYNGPLYITELNHSIHFADFSIDDNNNRVPLFMGANNLLAIIGRWNTWVSQFEKYYDATTFTDELGISPLFSLLYTNVVIGEEQGNPQVLPLKQVAKQTELVKKMSKEKLVEVSPYEKHRLRRVTFVPTITIMQQNIVVTISNVPPEKTSWETILSGWVLPKVYLQRPSTDTHYTIPGWQAAFSEPYSLVSTSNGDPTVPASRELYTAYNSTASRIVRQIFATQNDLDLVLAKMAEQGRGGMLGSFLSGLASSAFGIPKGITDVIGNIIPI